MVSDRLEVEERRENETTNGVHVRFEPSTLNLLLKLSSFATLYPLDLTSVERNVSPHADQSIVINTVNY